MRIGRCALALWAVAATPTLLRAQAERMLELPKNGKAVAYHVVGSGNAPPLLLVNGGPGLDHTYLHMSDVWRRIGQTRRVVFFDQPGTGASSPLDARDTITIGDLLDGMERIRSALRAEKVDVLGHSWGGYVAMAYSLRHPERVRRLILIGSTAPDRSKTESLLASLFPDSLARGAQWRLEDPALLQEDFRRHAFMGIYSPAVRSRVLGSWKTLSFNQRHGQLLLADTTSLEPKVGTLTMPTLVTTGRYDAVVSPRTAWRIHKAIPASRLAVFEQSGHYPMMEEPEVFIATIESFLGAP